MGEGGAGVSVGRLKTEQERGGVPDLAFARFRLHPWSSGATGLVVGPRRVRPTLVSTNGPVAQQRSCCPPRLRVCASGPPRPSEAPGGHGPLGGYRADPRTPGRSTPRPSDTRLAGVG